MCVLQCPWLNLTHRRPVTCCKHKDKDLGDASIDLATHDQLLLRDKFDCSQYKKKVRVGYNQGLLIILVAKLIYVIYNFENRLSKVINSDKVIYIYLFQNISVDNKLGVRNG